MAKTLKINTGGGTDYPFIRAWGEYLGSDRYYIAAEVEIARTQNAPRTAIYRSDNKWVTWEEITDARTRGWIEDRANDIAEGN